MAHKLTAAVLVGLVGLACWASDSPRAAGRAGASSIGYRPSLLIQLRVSDLERSVKFYRDLLDFDVVLRSDELKWAELSFGLDGVEIGIGAGAEPNGSGSVSLNIGVKDIDAARKVLEGRGVVFKGETMTIPDKVRLAELVDPDGNRIRLAQSLTEADKK